MGWPQEAFLNLRQILTPKSRPATGGNLLYVKDDNELYLMDSDGTEHRVGDGTGVAGITIQDENANVATGVTQIDFQGAGVTTTSGTGEVVVTVPTPTFTETLPASIIDAKGDLIVGTAADTAARKAVGSDGQVLTADAASTGGIKWTTPATPAIVLGPGNHASRPSAGTVGNGILYSCQDHAKIYATVSGAWVNYYPPDLPVTSYSTAVRTDTPVVYFPLNIYSSGYADQSGNGRDLNNIVGAAPSSTSGAPGTATIAAAEWGASSGYIRTGYSTGQPTVGTYEFWIYISANPAATVTLMAWSPDSGSNGTCSMVQLLNTGKIRWRVFSGAFVNLDAPSALTTGAWHHVVCSIGGAGMKIRINKSTVASNGTGSATSPSTSSFRLHGEYDGANNIESTGALKMAHAAFYSTQLTDTRTDAHYDAI